MLVSVWLFTLIFPVVCHAQTVTLYAIAPTTAVTGPADSYSVSVGGVNSAGQTTYIEEIVQSVGYAYPTSGTKFISATLSTQTFYATLVQDATVQLFSEAPTSSGGAGVFRSCSLETNTKNGVCVGEIWEEGGPTFTTTFTGTVIPVYTVTSPPSTSTKSSDAHQRCRNAWLAVFGSVGLTLLLL